MRNGILKYLEYTSKCMKKYTQNKFLKMLKFVIDNMVKYTYNIMYDI